MTTAKLLVSADADYPAGTNIAPLAAQTLPDIADLPWRLEHTVDAVSTTFDHYLSWISGVVIEHASSRLDV